MPYDWISRLTAEHYRQRENPSSVFSRFFLRPRFHRCHETPQRVHVARVKHATSFCNFFPESVCLTDLADAGRCFSAGSGGFGERSDVFHTANIIVSRVAVNCKIHDCFPRRNRYTAAMNTTDPLSRNQAAAKLGVSPQQLTKWLAAGLIPGAVLHSVAGLSVWQIPANVSKPARRKPGRQKKTEQV